MEMSLCSDAHLSLFQRALYSLNKELWSYSILSHTRHNQTGQVMASVGLIIHRVSPGEQGQPRPASKGSCELVIPVMSHDKALARTTVV